MKVLRLFFAAALLAFSSSVANADSRMFFAYLYGGLERPALGDLDSFGIATVSIHPSGICYSIVLQNILPANAAHIHAGPPQVAGAIVVNLPVNASVPLRVANCVAVAAGTLAAIKANPQNFYVNVHNAAFAAGAARGQLH